MFVKRLMNFGLSENEAKIYLTALGLGPVLASTIAKKSGIGRTSVYATLESLKGKGLIGIFLKNGFSYFIASDPEVLMDIGENRIIDDKIKIEGLQQILPELMNMNHYSLASRPKINFYEGFAGIKQIYRNLLTAGKEIYSYWNLNSMPKMALNFLRYTFLPTLYKRHLNFYLFVPQNSIADNFLFEQPNQSNFFKLYRMKNFPLENSIDVTGQKIAFTNYQSEAQLCNSVYIEDNMICNSMKNLLGKYFENKD